MRAEGRPQSTTFAALVISVTFLALRDPTNGGVAQAAPRVRPGPDDASTSSSSSSSSSSSAFRLPGRGGGHDGGPSPSSCATAVENRHEVADSRGGVCPPLALDAATGCCVGATRQTVSGDLCGASCSEKSCCDSFAKCVVCCHAELRSRLEVDGAGGGGGAGGSLASKELPPVSPMHPSMWRKWLMMHDSDQNKHPGSGGGGGAGGGRDVRGESFGGVEDEYRVGAFDYCKHRCRSNSAVTKNENQFQDARHHCFGTAYVQEIGAQDTLSPGRDSLHEQNSDFKLLGGQSVELGLVPTLTPRSRGRHFNAAAAADQGDGGGGNARGAARYAGDALRTSGLLTYAAKAGDFIRHYIFDFGRMGDGSRAMTFVTLALFVAVMVFAMVGVCVCSFRDQSLARDITYMLK